MKRFYVELTEEQFSDMEALCPKGIRQPLFKTICEQLIKNSKKQKKPIVTSMMVISKKLQLRELSDESE